jgi:hypothetical protein
MLALKSTLNSYVSQKQNIVNSPGSYTKSVSVPHHKVITSSQIINSTINIPIAETSAWWAGRGANGDRVLGLHNIHGGMPIFDAGMFAQVRQKIIAMTGETNIDVPQQEIMIFGPHIMYQINDSGQYGTVQGTWHHGGEPNNGSIRFFYKLNKEQTRTETTYSTRQEHDTAKHQQTINNAQRLIDDAMQNIANFEQQEALAAKQKQEAEALKIKQQIEQEQLTIVNKLSSMTEQERSSLLIDIASLTDKNSIFTLEKIKELGFDAAFLAFRALQNNNDALFKLGLESGADYATIAKIVVTKNDVDSLERLASDRPALLYDKQNGFTLLQIAITENASLSMISKIIDLDENSVAILSDSGESALKLAIIGGDDAVIQLVLNKADLAQELDQIEGLSAGYKVSILSNNDTVIVMRLLKGEKISLASYLTGKVAADQDELDQLNNDTKQLAGEDISSPSELSDQ